MDTREYILNQGLLLWSRRGYEGVGVQEICEACNLSKPTLYHHFGSKAGLLQAVLEDCLSPFRDLVRQGTEYNHDITRNLNETTLGWFIQVRAHPDAALLYLVLASAGRDSESAGIMRPWLEGFQEHFLELFTRAAQDHGNMKNREQRYAASFQGLLDTYTRLHVWGDLVLDDSLAYPVVHQFMHGIFS